MYLGNHCSNPCLTNPVQNSAKAIVIAIGFEITFLNTYLKSIFSVSPLVASSVSSGGRPASSGTFLTNKNVRKDITATIPAGIKKTHCHGRTVTAHPPMMKIRALPLCIIDPNIAEKTPLSVTLNHPAFTLIRARALYD